MLKVDIWECKPFLIQSQLVSMESSEWPLYLKHVALTLCERTPNHRFGTSVERGSKSSVLKTRVALIPRMHRLEYTFNDNQSLWTSTKQLLSHYLVALAMTRRDGLSSRMIQSRRISTLPSFWNHVSISTESPLSRSAPSIPRNFKSQNYLIFTASN